jgi:hypothetical protein
LSRKVTAFWKKCQEKVGEEIHFMKKRMRPGEVRSRTTETRRTQREESEKSILFLLD